MPFSLELSRSAQEPQRGHCAGTPTHREGDVTEMVVRRVTVAWPVAWAVNAAYTRFHTEPRGRFFWPVWCALEATAVQDSRGSRRTHVARKLLEGSRRGELEWFEFPAKTRGVTDRHTDADLWRTGPGQKSRNRTYGTVPV